MEDLRSLGQSPTEALEEYINTRYTVPNDLNPESHCPCCGKAFEDE